MTIGTVHSLQGAERPIVVFSGAVSNKSTSAPFFDSSPSILNVAVSRAKKSFIYFGDPQHLFRYDRDGAATSGKPTAILGDHMRTQRPLAKRLYPLYLVIVEAPGKSRAISEILGKDYDVFATRGAIREIDSGDLGLGFDRGLRPRWKWRERAGDKPLAEDFAKLAMEIDSYEAVFIATDADMEGEAIAWHVTQVLAEVAGPRVWNMVRRVRLGDITRPALMQAFATPGVIDRNIASAAIARAIADRLIADRMASETNRPTSEAEAAREAAIVSSLVHLTGSGKRAKSSHYHPGRVQAGILRLVYDSVRRDAGLGRFRILATVRLPEGVARGYLVLPEREFRIDAPDADAARRKLQAIVTEKLPGMIAGYEHDGVTSTVYDLGPPPFLSTIEVMRRAVHLGLMPWDTMQALQNLYLGQIRKNDYLGEGEA
jgi:DNA topoisomerase IA